MWRDLVSSDDFGSQKTSFIVIVLRKNENLDDQRWLGNPA